MMTWCRLRMLLQNSTALNVRHYARQPEEFPKITVPQKMIERLEKQNIRRERENALKKRTHLKTLLIASKRKEFQYFKGQKFDIFDPKQLASHGWKNRKCTYDYFTLLRHRVNPAIIREEKAVQNFRDLDLDSRLVDYMTSEGIEKPTNIQSLLIPKLIQGRHVVCAAETGSGKTYAYLLPIIDNILKQKDAGILSDENKNSPHSVVVVPTQELANQVYNVCESMGATIPFTPFLLEKGRTKMAELKNNSQVIDLVVSTPSMLHFTFSRNYLSLSKMMFVVLDEADTLLDDSFSPLVNKILRKLQVGRSSAIMDAYVNEGVVVALVSATFPQGLKDTVGRVLPVDCLEQVTTHHLHHLMPHVDQKFIRLKSADKLATVIGILKRKPALSYMIFCNKQETCLWLSKTLEEMNIDNVCVTGFLELEERHRMLKSFLEGEHNIMVCTDVASRGINTNMVDHVINFDFPEFMSDYIHRAGRVGRVDSKTTGLVTSLVMSPWEVDLVWKIEIAARRQSELHNVNANIKRKLNNKHEKEGLELD